jgi:hypothetical protein
MLEYQSNLADFSQGKPLPSHHQNLAKAPTVTRSWREQMDSSGVARFELLAGTELRRAGYPLSGIRPAATDVLRAMQARGRWQSYRLRKKLGLVRSGA